MDKPPIYDNGYYYCQTCGEPWERAFIESPMVQGGARDFSPNPERGFDRCPSCEFHRERGFPLMQGARDV